MAHDEKSFGVAAVIGDMVMHPADGFRDVAHDGSVGSKNSAELKVPHFTRFTACQIGEESTG
jgi:hypothetical protein